jgi:hypothetical protein
MDSQTALIDRDIGPDPSDQVSLADNFASALQQYDQYVEGTAAQRNRDSRLLKQSFSWR